MTRELFEVGMYALEGGRRSDYLVRVFAHLENAEEYRDLLVNNLWENACLTPYLYRIVAEDVSDED